MSKDKEHPSFGSLSWARVSSNGHKDFYMSSVRPMNFISVKLTPSRQVQDGATTRAFSMGAPIFEVVMTEAQFAAFITTPNMGNGTPCTINYMQGEKVAPVPPDEQDQQYKKALQGTASNAAKNLDVALSKLDEILSGKSIRKGDLKDLKDEIQRSRANIGSTLPHILMLFDEHMERVREEAQATFEGAVKQRLVELGIGSLPTTQALTTDVSPSGEKK